MPVVTVRCLADAGRDVPRAASAIGVAVARAAGVPPTDILVVWQDIEAGHYVRDGVAPASQPAETHPALVEISSASGRSRETREAIMRAAADGVAEQIGVTSSNVRVLYTEAPPGTILGRGRFQ